MTAKPYSGTEVSVGKTQGQIDDLLSARRITDIRWTSTATLKLVEFHHAIREKTDEWCYSREVGCPRARRGHHYAHPKQRIRAVLGVRVVLNWTDDEKEQRRLMRLLYWMLKSKFEIIDAGLVVFEEEFMPHLTLGTGRRMWDAFKPELERQIGEGRDLSAGIGETSLLRALPSGATPDDA